MSDSHSTDQHEEDDMKINLTYSNTHFYDAQYYTMESNDPSNQGLSLSTADPMLYRGTQIDVNDFTAPSSSFGIWDAEVDHDAQDTRGNKQLNLPEFDFNHNISQSYKHNELPEVVVTGADERFARQLSLAPPAFQMDSSNCFTSPLSAPVLLEALLGVLESVSASFEDRLTYRLHARHPSIQGMLAHHHGVITFAVSLFQHPELNNCVLVEVQRRSGERSVFNQLFGSVLSEAAQQGLVLDESAAPLASASFDPPCFGFEDELNDDELDQQVMSMLTSQIESQRCHASRSAFAQLIDSAALLDQTQSLEIIQRGLTSYDEQQQIASLSLANSVLPTLSEQSQNQLLIVLLNAMDVIEVTDSLPVVCYMQELTRVISHLADSPFAKSQATQLSQRIASKARQWSESTEVAQRLEQVAQHLTVS